MRSPSKRYIIASFNLFQYKSALLAILSHPLPPNRLLPISIKHFLNLLMNSLFSRYCTFLMVEHEPNPYRIFNRFILFFQPIPTPFLNFSKQATNEIFTPYSQNVWSTQIRVLNSSQSHVCQKLHNTKRSMIPKIIHNHYLRVSKVQK